MKLRARMMVAAACLATGTAVAGDDRIVEITIGGPGDLARLSALGVELLACEPRPGRQPALADASTLDALGAMGMAPVVIDTDPQGTFAAERARALGTLARGDDADWWADYKPYDAVLAKMEEMRSRRPDLVEIFEFGTSHEGRPMHAMRITAPSSPGDPCRPAVLLNSVIHAREWITVMVNMYVAESLISGYDTDPSIRELVDSVEWVFVPVLNPDGYVYSWNGRRMHRKNMRRVDGQSAARLGVDLNRNFGFMWGGIGSSGSPASETYRGPEPFSEPETRAMRDLARSMPNLRINNDIHSYGELILFPWGHTSVLSPDHAVFEDLGGEMSDLIRAYRGRNYVTGPVYTGIYPVSGGTTDWFYGELGVWSFSYEVCCVSFNPSPTQIRPNAEETLPATLLHGAFVADRYRFLADLDRNCAHNFFDVAAFVDAYIAGDTAADFDANGSINALDFTEFLTVFGEGR